MPKDIYTEEEIKDMRENHQCPCGARFDRGDEYEYHIDRCEWVGTELWEALSGR